MKAGDKVFFKMSDKQSPQMTIKNVEIDETTGEKEYQLQNKNGDLHPVNVARDQLTKTT